MKIKPKVVPLLFSLPPLNIYCTFKIPILNIGLIPILV